MSFTATSTSRTTFRARQTIPMPPAPIGDSEPVLVGEQGTLRDEAAPDQRQRRRPSGRGAAVDVPRGRGVGASRRGTADRCRAQGTGPAPRHRCAPCRIARIGSRPTASSPHSCAADASCICLPLRAAMPRCRAWLQQPRHRASAQRPPAVQGADYQRTVAPVAEALQHGVRAQRSPQRRRGHAEEVCCPTAGGGSSPAVSSMTTPTTTAANPTPPDHVADDHLRPSCVRLFAVAGRRAGRLADPDQADDDAAGQHGAAAGNERDGQDHALRARQADGHLLAAALGDVQADAGRVVVRRGAHQLRGRRDRWAGPSRTPRAAPTRHRAG